VAQLLLFASAREAAGTAREDIHGTTVAEVLAIATERFGPSFQSVLASCTIWLNGDECSSDAPVGVSDEVAVLPPISGGSGDADGLTLTELRERRAALQRQEDAVSYVRRLAQGRLDIARDEQRRRSTGLAVEHDVTDGITRLFAEERGAGSNRPPRDTIVAVDHPLVAELERLCVESGFGGLHDLDDAELEACCRIISDFEARVSAQRRQLFAEIDALSTELVVRYRSKSNVDDLLDER
jgi:molybdopterin converting factor small subunit